MGEPSEKLLQTIARMRAKRARRCPPWVRREVFAYAEQGRAAKRAWSAIADDLGMTALTLQRWVLGTRRPGQVTALAPVEVVAVRALAVEPPPSLALTLTSPGGYRVEGLDAAAVTAVLRALG